MTNDEIPKHEVDDDAGMSETRAEGSGKSPAVDKPYDLAERTALFGEAIIEFGRNVPATPVTRRLIDQLVGAGTSVGTNYREADDAPSKKAFRNSISICKREARESKFFLRMMAKAVPELADEARPLWQEARELHLIFAKIQRG